MRRLLATTAVTLAVMPAALHAQDRLTLWDVLSLDRIAQVVLHSGIQTLRTQMDLQYDDLTVDLRRSRVTMTGLTAWPFFDWDETGGCQIDVDRITLLGTPIDVMDRMTAKVRLSGVTVTKDCFPSDMHQAFDVAGLDELALPRLTLDVDYGMPKSDAMMRIYGDVTGVAAVDLSADFNYFWFDGRDDMEAPTPVMFLKNATLAVENKGVWEAVSPMLPPAFTGEEAGASVQAMLEQLLQGEVAGGLNEDMRAFTASVGQVWPQFLASPEQIVVESGIDGDVFLDFEAMNRDLGEVFTALKPRASLAPARVSAAVPVELLSRATGDAAAELSDAEKLSVGEALVTGVGAPRNVSAGLELLQPLAEAGDGGAALLLARALEVRAPEDAYLWALRAGKSGEAAATAMLDKLEDKLPFAKVLELQDTVSGSDSHPGSALRSVAGIRDQAAMRLSGIGAARSYGIAAMWAMLAKAAGDPEASDMLEEIDEIVRLSGTEAQAAWTDTEAGYAALAMEVWIGQNLPARYSE